MTAIGNDIDNLPRLTRAMIDVCEGEWVTKEIVIRVRS